MADVTFERIQSVIDAADTAIDAENWSVAENKLIRAMTLMAAVPEGRHDQEDIRLQNMREAAKDSLAFIRQQKAEASRGGMRVAKLKPVTPEGEA